MNEILKNKRILILVLTLLVFVVTVIFFIPKNTTKDSILDSNIVETIDKKNREDVEKLKDETTKLRKEVFDKITRDSLFFDKKTKEITSLKIQIKNLEIENEKKHLINNNTSTEESVLILRDNIKKRTSKGY